MLSSKGIKSLKFLCSDHGFFAAIEYLNGSKLVVDLHSDGSGNMVEGSTILGTVELHQIHCS